MRDLRPPQRQVLDRLDSHACGGTRTPTAKGHEDLNLARLPVPPRPRACRERGLNRRARTLWIVWSPAGMAEDDVVIEHPNREKAASKATKAVVVLLLLVSV